MAYSLPSGGSRLPLVRRSSSIIRETPSETTVTTTTSIPRSTGSSGRSGSCSGGAPCGSRGSQSLLRPPASYRGTPATTPGISTRTPGVAARTPATGRTSGVCPGSTARYGAVPTRTSAGPSRTPAPQTRLPGPGIRTAGICPGSAAKPTGLRTPASGMSTGAIPRTIPAPAGRPIPTPRNMRPPSATPRETITTRSSKTMLPDGTQIEQSTSRIDRAIPRSSGYGLPMPTTTSGTSIGSGRSTGAIPKIPRSQVVAQSSKTSETCGKKTTVSREVTKSGPPSQLLQFSRPGSGRPLDYSGIPDIRQLTARRMTPGSGLAYPSRPASVSHQTVLERDVEEALILEATRSPGKIVKISGSRKSPGHLPLIMTDQGPIQATEQVITEKRVEKTPGSEKISRHITAVEQQGCGAIQIELDTQTLEPGGLPKRGDAALEAISVLSNVSIAPGGVKESETTIIYETTKRPERVSISPEMVERLVTEESMDIEKSKRFKPLDLKVISPKTYPIRKREHELKLNYTSMLELEQSVHVPEPNPDQEQEEVQPETISSIMHTEEQGHRLGTQPAQMYDVLFPDTGGETTCTVNSAAPAPLQDIIVPASLPEGFHMQGITQELQMAATTTPYEAESKPEGDVFSETVKKDEKKKPNKNVAKRGQRLKLTDVPLLTREPPPWAMEDLQPIIEIVGAQPILPNVAARTEPTHLVAEKIDEKDQEEIEQTQTGPDDEEPDFPGILEYSLRLEPPTHSSRVQLRGSTRPPWFPGYYVALPEIPDLVRIDKSPGHILNQAWQAVQPQFFPDDSIISV